MRTPAAAHSKAFVTGNDTMTREYPAMESQVSPESYYRDIVEGSLQGIIIQQDERIVYANSAMARLFGYTTPEEMLGLNPLTNTEWLKTGLLRPFSP